MSKTGQNNEVTGASKSSWKIKWIVGVILLMFAAAAAMNLPRGFSDDLSLVGKGKPSIVFIRDKNAVQTFDILEVMNEIRDKNAGQVEFLLTDFNTPPGRKFMAANEAPRVTLVLLDAGGKKVNIIYPPQTAESLQQEIDALLKPAK